MLDHGAGDAAFQRVASRLCSETDNAIALPDGLFPIADARDEHFIVQCFPALVDHDDGGLAVQALFNAVEQVHHGRRAHDRVFEQMGHVEAGDTRIEIEVIVFVIEQPCAIAFHNPWIEARGEVAWRRPASTEEEFAEIAQAAEVRGLVVVGRYSRRDRSVVFGGQNLAIGGHQFRRPLLQEAAIARRVGKLQRVEAGLHARADQVVLAAHRTQEDFRAAILVEEHHLRLEPFALRDQEVQHNGLAGAGRSDDQEVAEVALVKIEIVRRCGRRLQQCDGWPPVIAARASDRMAVEAGKPCEVGGRDQRLARDVLSVAGKLRPEARLQRCFFAHADDADFGQRRLHIGHGIVERLEIRRANHDREMMLAKHRAACGHIILRLNKVAAQREGFVISRAHPAQDRIHAAKGRLAIHEREALRDDHLVRHAQQAVELSGRGVGRVFLDRQDACQRTRAAGIAGEFERILAEAHAAIDEGDLALLERHRAQFAIEQEGEEFKRL